jgi:hypothetical protein
MGKTARLAVKVPIHTCSGPCRLLPRPPPSCLFLLPYHTAQGFIDRNGIMKSIRRGSVILSRDTLLPRVLIVKLEPTYPPPSCPAPPGKQLRQANAVGRRPWQLSSSHLDRSFYRSLLDLV